METKISLAELHKKYPGSYVAIVNGEVVGSGHTIKEARAEAKKRTDKEPAFLRVPEAETLVL